MDSREALDIITTLEPDIFGTEPSGHGNGATEVVCNWVFDSKEDADRFIKAINTCIHCTIMLEQINEKP